MPFLLHAPTIGVAMPLSVPLNSVGELPKSLSAVSGRVTVFFSTGARLDRLSRTIA